jgi:hypothetical protein
MFFVLRDETFGWEMLTWLPTGAALGVVLPMSWHAGYFALKFLVDLLEPLMTANPWPVDRTLTWRECIRYGVTLFVVALAPYVALWLFSSRYE